MEEIFNFYIIFIKDKSNHYNYLDQDENDCNLLQIIYNIVSYIFLSGNNNCY